MQSVIFYPLPLWLRAAYRGYRLRRRYSPRGRRQHLFVSNPVTVGK